MRFTFVYGRVSFLCASAGSKVHKNTFSSVRFVSDRPLFASIHGVLGIRGPEQYKWEGGQMPGKIRANARDLAVPGV